ncbi:YodL domain-containing protein [Metabacillus fastidiosus]|uniref:YodL domain-containing protein n=1 Tax=Metabacillus fastidiosus TaxID=1458 RepID=UPI002E1D5AB4|nr:YodL domain-containing protein [Metabacillus fastidiosus]
MVSSILLLKKRVSVLNITVFQTPFFGEEKGYEKVYETTVKAFNHKDALEKIFRIFNVPDLIPDDYAARFISTGDILLIDEGRKGKTYYRLQPGNWEKVSGENVR